MGIPVRHAPAKLVVGLISNDISHMRRIGEILQKKFGHVDRKSAVFDFSCTGYYTEELGKGLMREFLSFRKPVKLERSYRIKLFTNRLERQFSRRNLRTVNIDPGYISLSKLVLFTTKNRSHRMYLGNGIYGDLELEYAKGTFRPRAWTYTDYRTQGYIDFFNSVRALYREQVQNAH